MKEKGRVKDLKYYMDLPYTKIIKKDPYGGYFVSIQELNGCISQGETEIEALNMINDAMIGWIETAIESGVYIPEPENKIYSGKFLLRIPKSLHRDLNNSAREEGISLNQYVLFLLTKNHSEEKISYGFWESKFGKYTLDKTHTDEIHLLENTKVS